MPELAQTDAEIEGCFPVMAELRPHLQADTFVATVRQMQAEGYQLAYLAAPDGDKDAIVAVAGFRIYSNLFMGRHMYVDDLVTASAARSCGYGEALLGWLRERAQEAECKVLHLDSGTHRGRAHKFYFEQGMTIASYHFSEQLGDA